MFKQPANEKFIIKHVKSPVELYHLLIESYGDECLLNNQVFFSFEKSKKEGK